MHNKIIFALIFGFVTVNAQQVRDENQMMQNDSTMVMEVACGECMFGLPGEGCDLAVRFEGKAYFVSGTHIDDHGDAHAHDGFCNSIRTAHVSGELQENTFHVRSLELIPTKDKIKNE